MRYRAVMAAATTQVGIPKVSVVLARNAKRLAKKRGVLIRELWVEAMERYLADAVREQKKASS
jgi:hypothetical protein